MPSKVKPQFRVFREPRGLTHFVRAGGLLAYPTESVFGLGCDPRNRTAVSRILRLKGRPQRKGLILIGHSIEVLMPFIGKLSSDQYQTMLKGWQAAKQSGRPHTWLVPAAASCPKWLTGRHTSIAVRLSHYGLGQRLSQQLGMALVSTSANRAGGIPAKSTRHCARLFSAACHSDTLRLIRGRTGGASRPSTIQDLSSGKILRH